MKNLVSICFESELQATIAKNFAHTHSLIIEIFEKVTTPFALYYRETYVELIDLQENTSIHVDFVTGALAHRRKYGGGKGQSIAKAIGIKNYKLPLTVLDITAGLAKDSFVLACLGCKVTMIERHPIVAELVNNALIQAQNEDDFKDIKQQGFSLVHDDAINYLRNLKSDTNFPDVIYMDPMYPERKKSAAVKKNMQMLQKLIGHNSSDDIKLFNIALTRVNKRVVVKRPKGAPTLTEKKPTMSIESKITRYDVYVVI